jgi:hypothetical protein
MPIEQSGKDDSSAAAAAAIASKHSPGPWRVDGEFRRRVIKDAKGKTVVVIEHWTTEPDAHLIAAAPDLLEALTELMAMLRKEAPGTTLNNHRFDALGIKCNAAIKRATEA